jgi:D-tagatose-1,6-bisphosphate aldolase subunit GatZ/KbaZ
MVQDHFVILKVGPALTFAFREAALALERIEVEWLSEKGGGPPSRLADTLETVMVQNPEYWAAYYRGEEAALLRRYSYSDRVRYYWAREEVQSGLARLLGNLPRPVPLTLVSQYLPAQYRKIRQGRMSAAPEELIRGRIEDVLDDYFTACGSSG